MGRKYKSRKKPGPQRTAQPANLATTLFGDYDDHGPPIDSDESHRLSRYHRTESPPDSSQTSRHEITEILENSNSNNSRANSQTTTQLQQTPASHATLSNQIDELSLGENFISSSGSPESEFKNALFYFNLEVEKAQLAGLRMCPCSPEFKLLPNWIDLYFPWCFMQPDTGGGARFSRELCTKLNAQNFSDLFSLRVQPLSQIKRHVGLDYYKQYFQPITEFLCIIDFVASQFMSDEPTWTLEMYFYQKQLHGRVKDGSSSIPSNDGIPELVTTPQAPYIPPKTQPVPPPYQAISPAVRPQRMPQRSLYPRYGPSGASTYHSSPPAMTDTIGEPYNQILGGVGGGDGGSSHGSSTHSSRKTGCRPPNRSHPAPGLPLGPPNSRAEAWRAAEQADEVSQIGGSSVSTNGRKQARSTHHLRYDAPAKARSAINTKGTWDGMRSTFDMYKIKVEGHLMQVGAGYLLDEHFQNMYKLKGFEYIISDEFWSLYGVGIKQAKYDKTYLFGVIVSTNSNVYNKAISKHKGTQDGILTWMEFQTLYAHDGSKELKIEQLEEKLQVPFSPGKLSLSGYIDRFQDTMERLDNLCLDPMSDRSKKLMLLRNVRGMKEIAYLAQHCRDSPDMSYDETAAYLRSNSILIDSQRSGGR